MQRTESGAHSSVSRRKLAFVRGGAVQKMRSLRQQRPLLLRSLMARGGRENGAKRRNPNQTLNAILDIQDGVFVKFVRYLSGEKYPFYFRYSAILSNKISSAGSHFTDLKFSRLSQVAASCSFKCKDSDRRLQIKQCIVR